MKNVEDQGLAELLARAKELERNEVPHPAVGERIIQNLRTELAAPAPKSRARAGWLLVPAAIAIAGAVLLIGRQPALDPESVQATGSSAGLNLEATDRPSSIDLPDFGTITLEPTAKVVVAARDTLDLERGTARIRATPLHTQRWLVAGPVRLAFTSARFEVTRTDDALLLAVSEGVVDAHVHATQTAVHAGETWRHVLRAVAPPPTLQGALERLEADDVDGALEIYAALAEGDDRTAEIAQYYWARLVWRERGRGGDALDALRTLSKRFPDGDMQLDASLLTMAILSSQRRCDAVRALSERTARRFGVDAVAGVDPLCMNVGGAPTTKQGRQ